MYEQKEAKCLAELKLVSPLLSNMEVVSCISARGAVSVYLVKSTKTAQTYILKHISVPESQKQVDALLFTGAASSTEDAQKYYEQVVTDYREELETLEQLAASPNLDCFRSYQIEPKEDGVGFDIYLLAEHRTTLNEYLADNAITHLCAVNLAMDLCSALVDLRAAGLVHRDVKPGNIYLNSQGHFVLGDLGIAKIEELKYCSMPENMLSSYSAPELFSLVGSIEPTTDIYSVGLILYRIYNGNHAPFEDERTSAKAADKLRITGKDLPAPMYADYEMAEIIHKACAFKPEDRYQDPNEMKQALVEYMKRNQSDDTLIVPPISGEIEPVDPNAEDEVEPVQFADSETMAEDFKENFSPDTQMLNDMIESVHREMDRDPESYYNTLEPDDEDDDIPVESGVKKRKRKKRNKWLPAVISLVLLLAIAGAVAYFVFIRPATVHVNAISLLDVSTDTVSVFVDSNEADGAFDVLCTDSYGNQSRQAFASGKETVFTGLTPGTQYTVSIDPLNKKKVTGTSQLMATTIAQTSILSFTATTVTVTQAELNLIIQDGPDPGVWTVEYSADGVEPKTTTFNGHSTVVAGLESGKDYTFTLQEPEGTRLTGQTKAYFSTVPAVSITGIKAALSSTTAILSWTIEGDAPENWTVEVTGPDGYADSQVVSSPTVTLEGLTSGETYEVMISTPTMLENCSTKITPNVTALTSFTAEPDLEAGTLNFTWECENEPADNAWTITARLHSENSELVQYTWTPEANTNSYTVDLADLLPEREYDFTLNLASGDKLDGENVTGYTTPNKDKFRSYGTKDFYLGLFLKPDSDTFTSKNLSVSRTSFDTDEFVAFALQSINNVKDSGDTVPYTMVLTDKDGKIVDAEFSSITWNGAWTRNIFAGFFPRMPQTAGDYTLTIYFNNQFTAEKAFTVNAAS